MSVELFRIDDRLIHGQVVVGWGKPLDARFISLVDDAVAQSDWEQELYRLAVPTEMDVYFDSVDSAARSLPSYLADVRRGILLTGDVETMYSLAQRVGGIGRVTIGGLHYRPGRVERLPYVFLSPDEEIKLRAIEAAGAEVVAQDLPTAPAVPLSAILDSAGRR